MLIMFQALSSRMRLVAATLGSVDDGAFPSEPKVLLTSEEMPGHLDLNLGTVSYTSFKCARDLPQEQF